MLWREGIAARVGREANDHTQGSLWSGSRRTILRAALRSLGWALPAVSTRVSASQDRPRDVFLWRGRGLRIRCPGYDYIIYPSLYQIRARSTVEDGLRLLRCITDDIPALPPAMVRHGGFRDGFDLGGRSGKVLITGTRVEDVFDVSARPVVVWEAETQLFLRWSRGSCFCLLAGSSKI